MYTVTVSPLSWLCWWNL